MKRVLKVIVFVVVGIFALIGALFVAVFVGMQFGLLNVRGSINDRNQFFNALVSGTPQESAAPCLNPALGVCSWAQTPEWATIKAGLTKDAPTIERVSSETGVPARLIAAVAVPEQVRFFTSEREVFKRYFEPLKILGSLSQFSLGVSGIKQETANQIEQYAASSTSPLYPGPRYAALVSYPAGSTHDSALYDRLTDPKDHYYSYLYTALFIKEIEAQWQAAGFGASLTPGAVVTLFNIGFGASHPNAAPQTAGAPITVGGITYSYGQLGEDFYSSSELTDLFPAQ